MPKCSFPVKIRDLINRLNLENLKSGFAACGISPFNPEAVLKRLPHPLDESINKFDEVIVDHLQSLRKISTDSNGPSRRRTKLVVTSGKAVGVDDVDVDSNVSENFDENEINPADHNASSASEFPSTTNSNQGDFVLVKLKVEDKPTTKLFIGQFLGVSPDYFKVSYLKRVSKNANVFPEKDDVSYISQCDIIEKIIAIPDRRGLVWTVEFNTDDK